MKTSGKLKAAIVAAGITQKEVARAVGLSESALSNILAGRRTPSIQTAEAILAVLRERTGRRRGLTMNDLVSERGAA